MGPPWITHQSPLRLDDPRLDPEKLPVRTALPRTRIRARARSRGSHPPERTWLRAHDIPRPPADHAGFLPTPRLLPERGVYHGGTRESARPIHLPPPRDGIHRR